MKKFSIIISIALTIVFLFNCSNSTEPTPLEDILYGNYNNVGADFQPDSTNPQILDASPTDSVYLILNVNQNYSMRLELYVEILDTVISLIEEGTFITSNTKYYESEDLTVAHWKGEIEFIPQNGSIWGGEFWIPTTNPFLKFTEGVFVNIRNSISRFWILTWAR
ncbi:MAG TPA: hypothetical protein VIZ21_03675 [Ignavibacteriaceae bacterium]